MNKEQRLKYMQQRFPKMEQVNVILSVSKAEIVTEAKDMDTYREYMRDKVSMQNALTSDEIC
jgi:hypothetical protein